MELRRTRRRRAILLGAHSSARGRTLTGGSGVAGVDRQEESQTLEPMSKRRKQDEHAIQSEIVATVGMMRSRYPEVDLLFAIPNGGARDIISGGKLKAEGVRPGVPDLMLAVARGPYHGLFVEVKTDAGHLSEPQKAWQLRLNKQGFSAIVVRGVHEGVTSITDYLSQKI